MTTTLNVLANSIATVMILAVMVVFFRLTRDAAQRRERILRKEFDYPGQDDIPADDPCDTEGPFDA